MKSTSLFLMTLLLVLSSFSIPADSFYYSSNEGKISATFPGEYEEKVTEGDAYKTTQIISTVNDQSFMASYTLHENDLSAEDGLEQISLDAFAKAIKGEIESQKKYKISGNQGLRATIVSEENDAKVDYIVVLKGDVQYQIAVFATRDAFDTKTVKNFFKSIKIQ